VKTLLYTKTLIALALAVAAAACAVSQAQEQPIPPPAGDSALPADIVPGSALAEVVKMVQAGVDVGTIKSYIVNSQSAFNLDADKIIFLKDAGAPSDLVNAMMERDKILYAASVVPAPAPAPVSAATIAPDTAPPAEVTVNYFYDTLALYGSWVDVEGYGRCWRPTVVIYDPAWRPYCDRGHWVYTDYGWYWDSDYSWGVTFHYGRWFRNPQFGWCWSPDTVWAPSWVTWRSDSDYCGWAPLPPLAVYQPGLGFFYRGASVGVDFDFGLDAGCFMFISPDHFCDRRPRYYCLEPQRAAEIFHQTRVINNFNVNGKAFMNRGVSVQQISGVTRHPIEPVRVGSLPNAGRQGWRGEKFDRPAQHGAVDNNTGRNFSSGDGQLRPGPALRNEQNNDAKANASLRPNLSQPAQGPHLNGNQGVPSHPQSSEQPSGLRDHLAANHSLNPQLQQSVNPPASPGGQNVYQVQRHIEPQVMDNNHVQAPPPRQFTAPSQPRVDPHPSIAEPAPRSVNPPPQPAPASAPAPVPSPPHNASAGSGHGSDKDKQNH
jgi:hypothetical protein